MGVTAKGGGRGPRADVTALLAELALGATQGSEVAAVGVEQQHVREGLGGGADELDDDGAQRLLSDRERARERLMFAAGPIGQRWSDDRPGSPSLKRRPSASRDGRVGPQRQVRTVLLGRPQRHDQQVPELAGLGRR